ncbi:zinc finger protein 395-like [Aulostomus maculatus]
MRKLLVMLPKTRLGKRSPLGALLSTAGGMRTDQESRGVIAAMVTAAGLQDTSSITVHPGPKCEPAGLLDQNWFSAHPSSSPLSSWLACSSRCTSSSIDVPGRRSGPEEVDMDQMMAALVLSSLSCSPLLSGPAPPDPAAPGADCGGSELSDSGSSGYWSVGHGNRSPTPSSPMTEPNFNLATPPDEGLEMEMEQVLFSEPAPRRRRNSANVAYRCLWPGCEKVLTSVVGIKRHIRITHLCRLGEHERCSRSEEDFYYTEINLWDQQQSPPLPSSPSPPPPVNGALSRSAPSSGSFWQVQSEHSYQAPPPSPLEAAAALNTASCRWMAPPTTCHRQAFRARSVSVGEQWLQHQSTPCRRIRGEAKKCRKVYGIEHRDQWCTACRWKKACQRFLD